MRRFISFLLAVMLLLTVTPQILAEGYIEPPYNSYNYNEKSGVGESLQGYKPTKNFYGSDQVKLDKPQDMYIDEQGNFYITNANSKNVTIFDKDFNLISVLSEFICSDGSVLTLQTPEGVFYKDGLLYVCDTEQSMVIISDIYGNVKLKLEKPESEVYPQDKVFYPTKVVVDKFGYIYVLSDGVYYGALCYTAEGKFYDFYGSNTVDATADIIMQRFWRSFMTEKQIDNTSNIVPVEYTAFDIDADSNIFTCTATASVAQIKKLNSMGKNMLESKIFGDLKNNRVKGKAQRTSFVDICVDSQGFIYSLDENRGRIFVYDTDGSEIFVFGALGRKLGCFTIPTAIDEYNGKVYVLDAENDSVTEFEKTLYGNTIYEATVTYASGNYSEATGLWEDVLRMNDNYSLAYVGIGKSLYYQGDYKTAMQYFKLGGDKELESRTFAVVRKIMIRKYASVVIIAVFVVVILILLLKYIRRKRGEKLGKIKRN